MSESIQDGFLLIDKPAGITSHDVIDLLRRSSGIRRIGHAGTLDPFATGLLLVGVGKATKELSKFVGLDKVYEATFVLGASSSTDDPEGVITRTENWKIVIENTQKKIEQAMKELTGKIQQIPPTFSAIKIKGKKMYEAAREGKPLVAPPRTVTVYSFELIGSIGHIGTAPQGPISLRVRIHCGSGTYIRALARDLGAKLGVGGYVSHLRRTAIGSFTIDKAVLLSVLTRNDKLHS
ncbi:MAG: tRNA pseudouridine(55) synthase TruB [Patescibacteria group bacterium]